MARTMQNKVLFGLLILCAAICTVTVHGCFVGSATSSCSQYPKPIRVCTLIYRPVCGIIDGIQNEFGNHCAFCGSASRDLNARITKCGPCSTQEPYSRL